MLEDHPKESATGTLVLIVLTVAVLTPIGLVHLIRATVAANEAQVLADTKEVINAEQTYASANGGFFDDIANLCRSGAGCRGIGIPGYPGHAPDFLRPELARPSPYRSDGYERVWHPWPALPQDVDVSRFSATSILDFCYASHPVAVGLSGDRSFSGTGTGAIYHEPSGAPIECPIDPSRGWFCIAEGGRIDTPDGEIAIEHLDAGDEVWGRSADGERARNTVLAIYSATVDGYLRIHFENGTTLELTDVHPVSTPDGWRQASELSPGDDVHTRAGLTAVARIDSVSAPVAVYDLTVEPDHNFFANGILVHNKLE